VQPHRPALLLRADVVCKFGLGRDGQTRTFRGAGTVPALPSAPVFVLADQLTVQYPHLASAVRLPPLSADNVRSNRQRSLRTAARACLECGPEGGSRRALPHAPSQGRWAAFLRVSDGSDG